MPVDVTHLDDLRVTLLTASLAASLSLNCLSPKTLGSEFQSPNNSIVSIALIESGALPRRLSPLWPQWQSRKTHFKLWIICNRSHLSACLGFEMPETHKLSHSETQSPDWNALQRKLLSHLSRSAANMAGYVSSHSKRRSINFANKLWSPPRFVERRLQLLYGGLQALQPVESTV